MQRQEFYRRTVDGARESIFYYIRYYRDKKVIYFDGWDGFGAASVLRSIVQVLPSIKMEKEPPELCFDKIISIDCSAWISEREMQRKIAEELELDKETMGMFDKHNEDDDFNGVDQGSRDVIRSVSEVIGEHLWSKSLIMIFLNGSDHEVDVSRFGIIPNLRNHVVVWTFKRRGLTIHDKSVQNDIANKLRYTQLFLENYRSIKSFTFDEFSVMLHTEAATMVDRNPCMQGIDLTMIKDCCLYCLFMFYCFDGASRSFWSSQAPNCMLCDGVLNGDITSDTINALYSEIIWECDANLLEDMFKTFLKDPKSPFLVVSDDDIYERSPYRWIWISTISKCQEFWKDMETMLAVATSCFIAFGRSKGQKTLPTGLLEQCSNIQVLILSCCTFNFGSPPFYKCNNLRFLGVHHCIDNKTSNVGKCIDLAFLNKLWTLDMRYTHWDEIITEGKLDLMTSLHELNIEGFCCWQYICKLHGRLCNIKRLRIIKPMQQAQTSLDCNNSFTNKTNLEILDLSGNKDIEKLPASLSKASNLQVLILDDCDRLENVDVSSGLPSSIRSFSFDGYGPATVLSTVELPLKSSRPKCAPGTNSMDVVKMSKICLQGCTKLENLFIRGLPNLEELDLSETIIKKLDFKTMVIDVPRLRRLFLLSCPHLRVYISLKLICIDTRAEKAPRFAQPSQAVPLKKHLQLHAILADAWLFRSLRFLSQKAWGVHFNIHITSSAKDARTIEPAAASKKTIGPNNNRQYSSLSNRYDGVLTNICDTTMVAFPEPPTRMWDRHIEFSDESICLETELASSSYSNLDFILKYNVQSLHVHDSMISTSMPRGNWHSLKWCRIERCPKLDTVFPEVEFLYKTLETIWVSDLLMARSICSERFSEYSFACLQHLHICSCPRLQFVLLVTGSSFVDGLETIHIIRCGDLRHVFLEDHRVGRAFDGVAKFPRLTSIHLYDLPKLEHICKVKMLAPALETIRIKGCFGLRRLPAVAVREPGQRRPTVEIEKDVWDALEWDRKVVKMELNRDMLVDVGHHPDLFDEPPVHSRYFKKRHIRGTVLR